MHGSAVTIEVFIMWISTYDVINDTKGVYAMTKYGN